MKSQGSSAASSVRDGPFAGRARPHRFDRLPDRTRLGAAHCCGSRFTRALALTGSIRVSDVTLLGLAPRQAATVALLGKTRGPGGLDAEATATGRLLGGLGRLADRRAHDLGGWLGSDGLDGRLCNRLGSFAQLGQRRALALRRASRARFVQRTLARLAGYVLGHGSADKGLTAAPAGGIEAIGGIVGNQNRTSPMRCH